MAFRLGSSTYNHYNSWEAQANNNAKAPIEKIFYLLSHWKEKNKYQSLRALVMELNKKLSKDETFNCIGEKISQHFL